MNRLLWLLEEALDSRNTASTDIDNKLRESAFHAAVLTDPEIGAKKKTLVVRSELQARNIVGNGTADSIATLVTGGIKPVNVLRMRNNKKGKHHLLLVFATFAEAKRARQYISARN
jgi:hypothetical protein